MTADELTPLTSKTLAALQTGLDESKIHSVAFELDFLRKNGLLIDVNISGVGMFTRSAQLGELGISKEDEKAKRYSPGSKYLIPKEKVDQLRSVETRMRQAHLKFCTDVAGFRPYRWLPYTGYKTFKRRWAELTKEFLKIKEDICDNLDSYRDLLAEEFAAGARKTWEAIQGQGYGGMIFNHKGYYDRYEFTDAVVDLALAQFPTAEKIERELQADYIVGVIYTDFDYRAAQAEYDAKHEAIYARADKAKAEKQAAYLQSSLLQEQIDHEHKMNQYTEQQKALEIEAMMAAEVTHAKEQLEQIRHPFEEVFIRLRQDIAEACDEIKASIEKNGFVRGKIAERAKGLIQFYDLMAAHNDKELRMKLIELRNQIGAVGDERAKDSPARNPQEISKTLEDLINMANLEAGELSDLSRAAFIEVDNVTED